jgi:prepilin-type N-terminal cleavage/methylation domain-containing protein
MKKTSGFTLIELMVVISIIGFLTTLALASFSTARSQSRDQKKISDIGALQLSLEQYFNKFGYYPTSIDILNTGQPKFLAQIPIPPSIDAKYNYVPLANPINPSICISYQLWATLEKANAVASSSKKGFSSASLPSNYVLCGGGMYPVTNQANPLIYDVMPQI